jgi:tetratricopeptide (TPR) repeat protein
LVDQLAAKGYWPARAAKLVAEGRYSQAVAVCREHLPASPNLVSGRLAYGEALFRSGQTQSAEEQYLRVLSIDPDNLVALKYLGDIKYAAGDEVAATAYYRRILEIDPYNQGLKCSPAFKSKASTRTISLVKGAESTAVVGGSRLRSIPFYTETIGDLYLAQGHARLAAAVFRRLVADDNNPYLLEKLAEAEARTREKDN